MNWTAFWHGAALCASLIVTIGAQNAFVLRQGILRSHVGKIVLLCTVSDFVLIGAGVGGASALAAQYPNVVRIVLYAGLAYLAWYGIGALRRACRPAHAVMDVHAVTNVRAGDRGPVPPDPGAASVMLMTLAFTWLNPHVYLDAMLLIGTAGAREPQGAHAAFALGAMLSSLLWFCSLGYGARLLAPLFRKASAWRLLDGATGGMVLLIAATQLR